LSDGLPLQDHTVLLSGRASFEMLQKAIMARAPIVCAISVLSSLAVRLARDFGVTLVGFLHGNRFNVYSRPDCICGLSMWTRRARAARQRDLKPRPHRM
jgi:FdhD protein